MIKPNLAEVNYKGLTDNNSDPIFYTSCCRLVILYFFLPFLYA